MLHWHDQDAMLGIRSDSLAGFSAATPAYQTICQHFDPSRGLARVVQVVLDSELAADPSVEDLHFN